LRDQYDRLTERDAAVLAVAPEEVIAFSQTNPMPFPCLADPKREVFRLYGVGSGVISLGQRPAVFLIGSGGEIRESWRGKQQWEIPSVDEMVQALEAQELIGQPNQLAD
jgi:peroxiredoxin